MPELIANGEQTAAVIEPERPIVAVEIRHVGKSRWQTKIRSRTQRIARSIFQRSQRLREGEVLLVRQRLVVKNHHRIAIHGGVNLFGVRGGQRFAKVDSLDFRAGLRSKWTKMNGHDDRPRVTRVTPAERWAARSRVSSRS